MSMSLIFPKNAGDKKGIVEYADRAMAIGKGYRMAIQRNGYRNVLYNHGIQWLTYDGSLNLYRPLGLSKTTPRPVTNRVASITNTAASSLVSYRVPITFAPASMEADDLAAAAVADKVNTVIEKETRIRELKPLIARWLVMTGNVFLIPTYDTGPDAGTVFVPAEQCQTCMEVIMPLAIEDAGGMCPSCGSPGPWGPAMKGNGEPMGKEYPRGRHATEIETIFTTYYDHTVPFIEDSPYFMVSRTYTKEWLSRVYGEKAVRDLVEERKADQYTSYVESLATTASGHGRLSQSEIEDEPRVRVRRLWVKPRKGQAPEGIYAVLGAEDVLETGALPFHDERGDPMVNVVHMGFDQVPGRLLAKTRLDDIIPKQDQRNRLESLIELQVTREAGSKWLVPEGVGISKIAGEPGQILRYNALANVPPPQRLSGQPVGADVFAWMTQIDEEMDAIFGQYEIGRGEAPKGVSAYAALQLLDERAQQGQTSLLENWSLAFAKLAKMHINIFREYADEERILSLGEGQWAMQKFSRADLVGGVDVNVELGQYQPRTHVARRAVVEQALRIALLNPMDPQDKYNALVVLGMPELTKDYHLDMQRAQRENDAWAQGMDVPPPLPFDDQGVHIAVHRRLVLSEKELTPEARRQAELHAAIHMEMQRDLMAQAAGPGQIVPGPAGGRKDAAHGDQAGTEQELLDQETQGASPDGGAL